MSANPNRLYTLEEYLEIERASDIKYEFWEGEIFAMSGGSISHDQIMGNMFEILRSQLQGSECRVFTNNMQIKVPAAPPYRYADGSVVCGTVELENYNGSDLLVNPVMLVEVLSPSTEANDRGDKFTWYKSISSFKEYLLIAQHRPHITLFNKQSDGTWSQTEVNDIDSHLHLPEINCTLTLREVYRDVEFKTRKH